MSNIVKLRIKNKCYCYNLPGIAKKKIEKDLTFENPKYKEAIRSGRYIPSNLLPELFFFDCDIKGENFSVPVGYVFFLRRFLKKKGFKVKVKDETTVFPKMDLKFHGELRDYQKKAVKDLTNYPVGMMEALTGAGKTTIFIGVIHQIKQPTLIVVHSVDLMYQWQKSIEKFLEYKSGLMGDQIYKVKDITVGIINTVAKRIDEIKDRFGMVIFDEGHRVGSDRYQSIMHKLSSKHTYGCSATLYRNDGLTHMLYAVIGPKNAVVDPKLLRKKKHVLVPHVYRVKTKFYHNPDSCMYSELISKLCKNKARNKLIANFIFRDYMKYKQGIIVVSERVNHLRAIQEELKLHSLLLTGKTRRQDRKDIIKTMQNGECSILFSTLSLIAEGYDQENLAALFFTTPIRAKGRVIQTAGRILRPSEGEQPRIYDFRDNLIYTLKFSGFARDRVYKTEWGS